MEPTQFDPYQLLTELSSSQATGVLKTSNGRTVWHLYLKGGELQYVDCSVQTLSQLSYFLCRQGLEQAYNSLKEMPPAIDGADDVSTATDNKGLIQRSLFWLEERQMLDSMQSKQLLEDIIQDALETFLWLRQGQSAWANGVATPEWVTLILGKIPVMELVDTVRFLRQRMKGWQNGCSEIWSPYQRPYLLDFRDISQPVTGGKLSPEALTKLAQLMSRGFSFRQLSVLLKQDELHIAQLFGPYVEQKVICLRNPQPPFDRLPKVPRVAKIHPVQSPQTTQDTKRVFKIVCIDDSPTILSEIERCLGSSRYEVTTVDDPIQASSIIFRIKPDLILLDITMPKINGYRLCSLLRSSAVFDETPIIMVTGNTGLIDKTRAKLAGGTDYFTKPFTQKGLTDIVEKYLKQLNPI